MISSKFNTASEFIAARFGGVRHDIAIVLGSGLGGFAGHIVKKVVLPTADIPDYPCSTVPGHSGEIISAVVGTKRVLVFSGRVHYYENSSTTDAAVTAIVSNALGIKRIVLTNAAGILNESFQPGDLMVIKDHINLTSRNVLRASGCSPVKLQPVYSEELSRLAFAASEKSGVNLKSGVYVGLTGPSYETRAEVRLYRNLGGDAVGMSTIHEATYARAAGMDVLGISCLTNYSTGITNRKLSHDEVTEIGARVDEKFSKLLITFIGLL